MAIDFSNKVNIEFFGEKEFRDVTAIRDDENPIEVDFLRLVTPILTNLIAIGLMEEISNANKTNLGHLNRPYPLAVTISGTDYYYRMKHICYYIAFDAPMLLNFNCKHIISEKRENHELDIKVGYDDSEYAVFFDYVDRSRKQIKAFGCWTKGAIGRKKRLLFIPTICQNGRLEALYRFICRKGRSLMVNSFDYFVRPISTPWNPSKRISDEDAWYYEMTTGLSLALEISETISEIEINHEKSMVSNIARKNCWEEFCEDCIADLLKASRDIIISCPLLYWRIAMLKDVIQLTDEACLQLEGGYIEKGKTKDRMQLKTSIPESKAEWTHYAQRIFSRAIINAFFDIGIQLDTDCVIDNFFLNVMGFSLSDDNRNDFDIMDLTEIRVPTSREYINCCATAVAQQFGKQLPNESQNSRQYRNNFISGNNAGPIEVNSPNNGFYCYCLTNYSPFIERMKQYAIFANDSPNSNRLRKIKDNNQDKKLFNKIHEALYGKEGLIEIVGL